MAGKTTALVIVSLVLTSAPPSFAQEPAEANCHGGCQRGERGPLCQRIWAWLTYRPLPVPREARRSPWFVQTATPPLYTYLLFMYGPRSPALGFPPAHHGDHWVHETPAQDALSPESAPPEESLPVPEMKKKSPAPPLPEPGALPGEAPTGEVLDAVPLQSSPALTSSDGTIDVITADPVAGQTTNSQ